MDARRCLWSQPPFLRTLGRILGVRGCRCDRRRRCTRGRGRDLALGRMTASVPASPRSPCAAVMYAPIRSRGLELCLSASCLVHLRCTLDPRSIKSKLEVRSIIRSHRGNALKPLTSFWKNVSFARVSAEAFPPALRCRQHAGRGSGRAEHLLGQVAATRQAQPWQRGLWEQLQRRAAGQGQFSAVLFNWLCLLKPPGSEIW